MKKILYIVNNLIVGGIEKVCWEIVSHIDLNQYQIDFLVAADQGTEQYYDPKIQELGCRVYKGGAVYNKNDKKEFLRFEKELIQENHYDIVHSHMDFMNISTLKVAKETGVAIRVSHVHTAFLNGDKLKGKKKWKWKIQQILLCHYATDKLGCSKAALEHYYGKKRGTVLYNGFEIKKKFNFEQACTKNIITVGRIDPQKNPEFIVEIIYYLKQLSDEFKLYWIGEGVKKLEMEQKAKKLGLEEDIVFVGCTTEIMPYLNRSGIAIYPSVYEGLGISVVESQLAGCFTFYSDGVPQEADIGYAMCIPLEKGPKGWAEMIYDFTEKGQYKNYNLDESLAEKYDVCHIVSELEKIYQR